LGEVIDDFSEQLAPHVGLSANSTTGELLAAYAADHARPVPDLA
jgi:hypothetical protein